MYESLEQRVQSLEDAGYGLGILMIFIILTAGVVFFDRLILNEIEALETRVQTLEEQAQ